MTEHGKSFLKSISSSNVLHSFFRYLILKIEILRQPVTKILRQPLFAKVFPSVGLLITPKPCCGQINDPQH